LHLSGYLIKLIQEERSLVSLYRQSLPGFRGPSKRAFDVAKQLTLRQISTAIIRLIVHKSPLSPA
jgi:hypothetical protein